jgi:hypothetical protein
METTIRSLREFSVIMKVEITKVPSLLRFPKKTTFHCLGNATVLRKAFGKSILRDDEYACMFDVINEWRDGFALCAWASRVG